MNKEDVVKRLSYIKDNLELLKKTLQKYESSNGVDKKINLKALERFCEEIIECATRINQEILIENGDIADSYRQSFEKLSELGLFDSEEFTDKLANTTGFRNRLAHDYIDLDVKITVLSAKGILDVYPKYVLNIVEYLEKKNK